MLTKIVERLKTGSVKNVAAYGQDMAFRPPYVVVRPEAHELGTMFRVFAHFQPGQNIFLEDYVFNELSDLLVDYVTTTRHGNRQQVHDTQEWTAFEVSNDDGTISMERRFLVPSRLF